MNAPFAYWLQQWLISSELDSDPVKHINSCIGEHFMMYCTANDFRVQLKFSDKVSFDMLVSI